MSFLSKLIVGLTRGFIRGKTLATTDDLTTKANTSHTHSTNDITSGTLPLARGGTGVTSISALKSALGISSSSGAKIYVGKTENPSTLTFDFTPECFVSTYNDGGFNIHILFSIKPMTYYFDFRLSNKDYTTYDMTWSSNSLPSLGLRVTNYIIVLGT